ncbi:MAG: serine hydrolase domain-containing protein [Steroidobacteraceae bacterium]
MKKSMLTLAFATLAVAGGALEAGATSSADWTDVNQMLTQAADDGLIAGASTIVWKNGKVVNRDVVGYRSLETKAPLRENDIFRMASTTKPVTAVCLLTLVDAGKIKLDDPIDKWIPELANRKVVRHMTGPLDDVYPSPRPIKVEDLLTYRIGYGMAQMLPNGPLKAAIAKVDIAPNMTTDEWVAALGKLPLAAPPGSMWQYNVSSDLMGVLIARVSGMPFDQYLKAHVLDPLKMNDTGFWVPREKLDRLTVAYAPGDNIVAQFAAGKMTDFEGPLHPFNFMGDPTVVPKRPSGAGGLYSTPDDFLRFARMLMNKGELEGVRVLRPETVALMTTNHLTPEQRNRSPGTSVATVQNMWATRGFGYGVSVLTEDGPEFATGAYGWPGAFGTQWTNDPKRQVIVLYFIQRMGDGNDNAPLYRKWLALTAKHLSSAQK